MASLAAAFERTVQQHGPRPAVLDVDGVALDWRSWQALVARTTTWLAALGLQAGQRFGVVALNTPCTAALLQAGFRGGYTPVPINHRLAPVEIAALLQQAACRRWLLDPAFDALADAPELAPWQDRCVRLQQAPWPASVAGLAPAPPRRASGEDEALLLFTGGTSGRAKGVPLSHAQILANALQVGSVLAPRADDVVLHVAPMFHSAELVLAGYALHGAANVYLPRFTPEAFVAAVLQHRATVTLLVPTMLLLVLRSGLIERHGTGALRRVIYGASPLPPDAIDLAARLLPGVQLTQGYGLTETGPLLTMLGADDHDAAQRGEHRERLLSCGRALPAVELRVVDAGGRDVPTGAAGEIVVAGPNVFDGYLDDAQATAQARRGGAFATGDVGCIDGDGYVYLLDRLKDVVITGGENVYSLEVEAVLLQHPAVAEAAVIGVPDAVYGEAVHGVVVLRAGALADAAALQQFCRGKIGGYKIPRAITFAASLPRSVLGKVLKADLRQQHAR